MDRPPSRSTADDVDLTPGTVVGEYRIDGRLAAGGMGTVYAATHPIIGKRAAIKVLKAQHSRDALLIQRFIDEARAVNHIGHDHIVDIFAFGELPDGRSYFVMEWLEGQSLKQALRRRPLPFLDAVRVLDELCGALHAAHVKGIVHRDLKPDNVFLQTAGDGWSVKLLDFGIAKLGDTFPRSRDSSAEATSPDVVMGTPDYISPEQATARETTAAADVYSLGIIAFELFTGQRPFQAEGPMEVLIKHVTEPAPLARSVRPEVPPALERLLASMLSKAPDERPTTLQLQLSLRDMARIARASLGMPAPREPGVRRPVLLRSGEQLDDLSRPLLSELSAGACWVDAEGTAPPVGTPVTLRFAVPHLDAQLDFAGVISGVFGALRERVLIRYDRVPKRTIDHVVELGSGAARSAGRLTAAWRDDLAAEASPWSRFLASEGGFEPPTDDAEPTAPLLPVTPPRAPRIEAAEVRPNPVPERPGPPPRSPWFGLGARMLALTLIIAAGAVASVTYVALRQARVDREFYVQDQNLTTARALAEALDQRATVWRKQLELTLANGVYRGPADEFTTLAACRGGCTPVFGELPSPDRHLSLRSATADGRLVVRAEPGGIWIATGTPDEWALARVSASSLEALAAVAPNVDLAVLAPDGTLVTTRGPGRIALEAQPFLAEIARSGARDGAQRYPADPSPLLAAWSRSRDLTVVVASPLAVTVEQIEVLTQQVTWVAGLVFAGAALLALLLSSTTTSRLRKLAGHARRVARGDFSEVPTVKGGDEVSELSRYFRDMTLALRQRDEEVLAAQRAMSADEARAVEQSLAEWLQQDLASRLEEIRRTVESTPVGDERAVAFKRQLEQLSARASNSLQSALLFASTSRKRIDLASAVRESVANLRDRRPEVRVSFEAPNAVLFPWIEADDSRLRELVLLVVERAIRRARGAVSVRLARQDRESVLLTVEYDGDGADEVARAALPLAREQRAEVQVGPPAADRAAVWVTFRTRPESAA